MAKTNKTDPHIKALLGFAPNAPDTTVRKEWNRRTKNVCKPCWELKYCPYGSLVEMFPLLPPTREDAIHHNEFLKKQLADGAYDKQRTKMFTKEVREFDPGDYPIKHDPKDLEKSCSVFGHICPVFFVSEPFTETQEMRRIGRKIPRNVMLRVARRDNNQCQICGEVLLDNEIEFDHIIPVSKGGSSEEHNVRVTCFNCNRRKRNRYVP
jgi:HNH endonuclease